jgi:hypothetical protein
MDTGALGAHTSFVSFLVFQAVMASDGVIKLHVDKITLHSRFEHRTTYPEYCVSSCGGFPQNGHPSGAISSAIAGLLLGMGLVLPYKLL